MSEKTNILTPVGRLVAGSLYTPNDKDALGNPLVNKSGTNVGQPRIEYFFAVAVPKGTERHWSETQWGALIWAKGHASFQAGVASSPAFAWKITDGDSTIPNTKGVAPVTREGYRGCWVLNFSSGFAPKVCNADGTQLILEPDAVKLGYFVQVYGTVDGNATPTKPGVFLNHNAVALAGYGEVINVGIDVKAVGFGGALPAGASPVPMAAAPAAAPAAAAYVPPAPAAAAYVPPAPAAAAYVPPAPAAAAYVPPAPAAAAYVPPAPAAAAYVPPAPPAGVAPHPGFLNVPTPDSRMTAAANGVPYAEYMKTGWTDALLIQHGMMTP